MGITDKKQKPIKLGYAVGPRLVNFIQNFEEFLKSKGEHEHANTAAYIANDIKARVNDGKDKYGQYLYTDDGICKFQQTSEELDDAIHYLFSNLIKQAYHEDCDIEQFSFQSNILQLKAELIKTMLDPKFIKSICDPKNKSVLRKIIVEDQKADVIYSEEDLN